MIVSSKDFVTEIQRMVRAKHSKNHPIIGMIEEGKLDREQLKGFVGQFYLFFPKPFPKPIAAMLSRCPDDPPRALGRCSWRKNVDRKCCRRRDGRDHRHR